MDYYAETCSIKASKTQRVVTDDYYPPVKAYQRFGGEERVKFQGYNSARLHDVTTHRAGI